MADQATQHQRAMSPALAEPAKHVRAGWVTGLSLASLAMWMASYTPLQVLLPIQLQDITPAAQARRARPGVRGRRGGLGAGHADRRRAVGPDHPYAGHRAPARPQAPLDAGHGAARRGQPGDHGQADHGDRRRDRLGLLQRLPEWRVRQPERGHPGPRPGPAAGHGGRLGRDAAGAWPGDRHGPRRRRVHRAGQRLCGDRDCPGGAGPAVRAADAGPSARPRGPGAAVGPAAGRLLLAEPAEVPGLRLGLADQFPDLAGDRARHAVPALLPARRRALPAAVPRPDGAGRPADPDRDLHRLRGGHGDRGRDHLRPAGPPQADRDDLRSADRRGGAAADLRRDVDRGDGGRGLVRGWFRRIPGRRSGADHPGAARGGTGPRISGSSTSPSSGRPRWAAGSRRCWSRWAATRPCSRRPPPSRPAARSSSGGSRAFPDRA